MLYYWYMSNNYYSLMMWLYLIYTVIFNVFVHNYCNNQFIKNDDY